MNPFDFEYVRRRYAAFWNRENHDRPLMHVTAWRPRTAPPLQPEEITRRWLDADYVASSARYRAESTACCGEAFPSVYPNLGPDIFAALYGAELTFGENTSWSTPVADSLSRFQPEYGRGERWYRKILELTEAVTEESGGDFLVGITDLHPGMDALAALVGPERLCTDLYDCPERVEPLPRILFQGMQDIYDKLLSVTQRYRKGVCTWMPVYSEKRFYVTSCDFICMISPSDFERFVRPELELEAAWLEHTVFHLDGPGALRHLDAILSVPGIHGIQWVPGDGALPASGWPEVLKRIQSAGKLLQIYLTDPAQLRPLSEILAPEGVVIAGCAPTEEEGNAWVRYAEELWRKK